MLCKTDIATGERSAQESYSVALPEELPTSPTSIFEPSSFLALLCPHKSQGWMDLGYQEKEKVVVKGSALYLNENHPFCCENERPQYTVLT